MPLVTRKGVFPYEYTDEWSKLEETALPPKHDFYSVLLEKHVSDEDYVHAMEVWRHFKCPTLGDYSDLYLKVDVLLLADVMENFRDLCMSTYNLDPVYYYTAPGFTFDAMLRYTDVSLELLTDYDMILFMEQGIRGGLVQASERYCRANNPKTPGYDAEKPSSWLVYQDCNNLYGYAMGEYMPYGGFKWYEGDLDRSLELLDGMTDKSDVGRIYEIDIAYPDNLHDAHNDLPFLPRNAVPPGSKVNKLMVTLERKERYIVHYRNLKQAIANGLTVEKVHRVLEFRQSAWLAEYINLNTSMRKKACNAFERDFFKLLNNAVFGKTMECVRNRISMELVSCPRRMRKLVNKPTFKHVTTYTENLAAVSLQKSEVHFSKPIYVGFAVLEISKELMYDYHYNVMRRHYNDSIRLLYMDTDSLVYRVNTEDFYKDLVDNPALLERMDTSNLPVTHPCYVGTRKKIPGLFKDETAGRTMYEFIALRAKSYAYKIEGDEKVVAKGIRGHVVRNHMTFEDHKRCLFEDDGAGDGNESEEENVSIRSFEHRVKTIKTMKMTLNRFDDKRVVDEDRIRTRAYGHYTLRA
ncbi:uncharacterized protein LOC112591876 [Melanaphis sacchari]|uniref:uncharacterized protein LOC112591876 n=1 Tax=Melanaphis sacchari TaxID=742174 RepID=UPI000DC13D6A|nr:uncharacterized protein LOC112591876 [Melanaphis sacchari]